MGYLQKARKILSLIVVVALMISLLSSTVSVNAAEVIDSDTYNGVTWVLTEDGTITISGNGPMHYSGSFAENWTKYCDVITSVVICEGITDIFSSAFDDCPNLKSITIPDSVTEIKSYAFKNCTSLTEVFIGSNVTVIGSQVFSGCTSLKKVTMTDNLKEIGSYAFAGCTSLADISIPESVTSLDDGVFSGCSSLKSMTIPDNVTSMGNYFFHACTSLTDVTIGSGITYLDTETFLECSSLTNVILPDGLEEIGLCAFENCTGLKNIDIPNSVTSIHQEAFSGCTSLTEIVIPDGVSEIYRETFNGCASLKKVTIGSGVTSIDYRAFYGCSSLQNISIPDSVNSISEEAFAYCSSLGWVAMGSGIASLSSSIFRGCGNLMDIYYTGSEEAWNAIESNRFTWSSAPEDMEIHYNSTAPENETGENGQPEGLQSGTCGDNLTWTLDEDGTLTISGSGDMTDWTETTAPTWYDWRESIVKVIIEDGVTSVGSFAFSNCPNLATVIVPPGVVQIGEGAFYNDIYQCNCATNLYYAGSEESWESDVSKGTNAFYRELSTYAVRFHYNSTGPEEGMERVSSLSPYNGATNVELGTYLDGKLSLVLAFDGEVALEEGLIQVCDYETGEVYRSVSAQDGDDNGNKVSLSADGKTVTIEFTNAVLDTVSNAENVQDCIPYDKTLCILIEENAIVFMDTGESFTIENPSSWQFTTEWGLTADVDLLSFHNSSFSFGCEHYTVSSEIQKWLISYALSDDDILGGNDILARIDEKIYTDEWEGSCYGMCAVVALAYTGNLDLRAWNVGADSAGNCASIASPSASKGEYGTLDLINYYHLLENIMDKNYVEKGLIFHKGWEETWSEIVSLASKLDSTNEPFILEIEMKDTIDDGDVEHSLLVTGYHMDNGNSVLETYDVSSDDYYAEIIINGDDVTLNSIVWGNGITVSGVAYTVVDELKKYNIDEFISSDDDVSALEDGDESDSASLLSAVEKSDDDLITSAQYLTDSTQGTDSTLETASTQEVTSTQEAASIQETTGEQETDYAKLYISAGGNFVVTNADGDTFSRTDGVFSVSMEVYDFYTIGEGSDYEYVIYTDPGTSFSYDTDSDSLSLTVYQDGIYTRAEAGEGTERITVVPGTSATVETSDAVEYMVHFSAESLGDTMIAVMGTSEGTVELDFTDIEQFQVVSAALKDTVIRYYDLNGTIPVDTAVEDSKSGILVDTAGGGAVSAVSETIDASSLFTLLFGFSRMQMIMIAGLGIAAVGMMVFGVLFAVRFLRRKK